MKKNLYPLIIAAVGLAASLSTARANLFLSNAGFDTPSVAVPPYTISGAGAGGPAAANGWFMYNNSASTTTSELLPSTNPRPFSDDMIYVTTNGTLNGIYQVFPSQASTSASVDVFVISGLVTLFLYTNSGTVQLASATSTTTGVWETLTLPTTAGSPNELILYSTIAGGANFYADWASVPSESALVQQPPPTQGSSVPDGGFTLMMLGMSLVGLVKLRRRIGK